MEDDMGGSIRQDHAGSRLVWILVSAFGAVCMALGVSALTALLTLNNSSRDQAGDIKMILSNQTTQRGDIETLRAELKDLSKEVNDIKNVQQASRNVIR